MLITENDFRNIDLKGLEVKFFSADGYAEIDLPLVKITIEKRPYYCDRGRYGFWADSKDDSQVTIDFADFFPRYFFSLQRAMDEINDWIEIRKLTA